MKHENGNGIRARTRFMDEVNDGIFDWGCKVFESKGYTMADGLITITSTSRTASLTHSSAVPGP